ncbi:hypothetical protein MTO96_005959 [Rhipicephalus appendiculatus]
MFDWVISANGRSLMLVEVAVFCCCCLSYSAYADTINMKGCAFCGYRIRACTPSLVQVYYNFTVAQRGPYLAAKSIFYHPDLDSERWMNDIALIMLEEPLHFDEYVMPVCLPGKQAVRDGAVVASPEWGRTKDEQVHKFLYHSTATIVPFSQCSKSIEMPKVFDMKWDHFLFCTKSNGKNPMEGFFIIARFLGCRVALQRIIISVWSSVTVKTHSFEYNHAQCGRSAPVGRVINGDMTWKPQVPWLVYIFTASQSGRGDTVRW